MAKQTQGYQEGSRWFDRRPEPDELARWFKANVRLHPELRHEHYLPGVALIDNTQYGPDVDGQGKKVKHTVWAPYPMVDTRIQYFWDFCEANGYLGELEKLPAERRPFVPEGFFAMPIRDGSGKEVPFIGVSYKVGIFEPNARFGGKGRPVRLPAEGTKIVPLLRKGYNGVVEPDANALAKAQTGAQGRALGFAGMLIVPGAGIATAEDMQEHLGREPQLPADTPAPAALPETHMEAGAATSLEELVQRLREQLESEHPDRYEEASAWCEEKGYKITEPPQEALRGLERQLRRKLEATKA